MASTIRFDKWEDSEGNPVLDASDGPINFPSRRNLLYNGAMQVHQRKTSLTGITTGGYYTADRWQSSTISLGTWTQSLENDAPAGSGFRKSWKTLCTTADPSPSADSQLAFQQVLEGQDLQGIAKGTISAKELTISFWVKSNVTGTYVLDVQDVDNTRSVGATYNINASATWEKKTITIPADSTGLFDNDSNASLYLRWWLATGSNRTSGTLNTTWASRVVANIAPGQTNLAAATNNYWQITGVQLEVGPIATPFEFKSFGQELAECQRYYYRLTPVTDSRMGVGYNVNTTGANLIFNFPVTMRIAPTALEQSGTAADYAVNHGATSTNLNAVPTVSVNTSTNGAINAPVASGLTAGQGSILRANNANAYLAWSAEL